MARPREPRIADLDRHPRPTVGLTVAAEYLGISASTVRARIVAGALAATRPGPKRYRIAIADLQLYLRRRDERL